MYIFNNIQLNYSARKSCRLWDKMEKYCRDRQTDNTVHAHFLLYK